MFRWYAESAACYVYLADVCKAQLGRNATSIGNEIQHSRWFTRGWTLQEPLAPSKVTFFDSDRIALGDRLSLIREIHGATRIDLGALRGDPLDDYYEGQRMQWAAHRETTEDEDRAYCLQGILGIVMSPHFGEGFDKAMERLIERPQKSMRKEVNGGEYTPVRSILHNGQEHTHYLHKALYHKLRWQNRCFHCGTFGHAMCECFANVSTVNEFRSVEGLCYSCGSSRHYAGICPFDDD